MSTNASTSKHPIGKLDSLFNASEFNRFGLIFVILTVVGCLGGIAVGLGAVKSTFLLSMIVVPTMATLSLLLAVSPMKWILSIAAISVLIDVLIIIFLLVS